MPHLTLEHSANLARHADFAGLCAKLAKTLIDQRADGQPVYPIGGVRVRAIACDAYCIADGSLPDAGFVHGRLAVASGRGAAVLKVSGDALFDVMKTHFAKHYEQHPLALSLEIAEFDAATWKHNNLHAHFDHADSDNKKR
jgi:5-carboxymethyl-2-hydroxymuconate isomerase